MKQVPSFAMPLLVAAVLALSACTSEELSSLGSGAASGSGANVATSESLAQAMGGQFEQTPLGLGCGWLAASDVDKANVAFPDSNAKYWVAAAPITPQTRLRIDGVFPDARYFSYNAYDAALRPTDAIADAQISPRAGSVNPFVAVNQAPGGQYTAYLQSGTSPVQSSEVVRAPNTFYAGDAALGPAALPNGLTLFIYRVYVSKAGKFEDGGVGLPTLTLETADGQRELGTLPNCEEPLLPSGGGSFPPLGLNDLLLSLDYPNELILDFPTATYPPQSNKFFGLGETVGNIVSNRTGLGGGGGAPVSLGSGGFLSNIHNAYTTTTFARRYGSLALVRAKAPTYRDQANVAFGDEQLRYWSLCGNEFATQRYTDCAADFEVPLDDQGFFTVVISDPADRPANATAENGFVWLPWGPYPDQLLIYRHMLHNPGFAQAIQFVEKGETLTQRMGDFAPQGVYCRPEVFVQSTRSSEVFALCEQDQNTNPPL